MITPIRSLIKERAAIALTLFPLYTLSKTLGFIGSGGCLLSLLCLAKGHRPNSFDEIATILNIPREYAVGFAHGWASKTEPFPRYPGLYDQANLDGFNLAKELLNGTNHSPNH